MFDLGPEKILVVMVFALVIFGPQRLPEVARNLGQTLRTLRGVQDDVRQQLTATLNTDDDSPASHAAADPSPPSPALNGDDPAEGGSFL